jgi:hypothetical protein
MQEDLRTRAINAGVIEFHWVEVPEGAKLPYAVARVVSDPRPQHLQGYTGMRTVRVQVDCLARTGKEAGALAEQLIAALSDPATVGQTKFGRCRAEGPVDLSEDVGGKTLHRKMIELFVAHRGI